MGWVPGSKMSGVYVHLSGRDTDEAILRAHGVYVGKEGEGKTDLPRRCPRCETWNESGARFCGGCSMALSLEAASSADRTTESVGRMLLEVLEDEQLAGQLRTILETRAKDSMK